METLAPTVRTLDRCIRRKQSNKNLGFTLIVFLCRIWPTGMEYTFYGGKTGASTHNGREPEKEREMTEREKREQPALSLILGSQDS